MSNSTRSRPFFRACSNQWNYSIIVMVQYLRVLFDTFDRLNSSICLWRLHWFTLLAKKIVKQRSVWNIQLINFKWMRHSTQPWLEAILQRIKYTRISWDHTTMTRVLKVSFILSLERSLRNQLYDKIQISCTTHQTLYMGE